MRGVEREHAFQQTTFTVPWGVSVRSPRGLALNDDSVFETAAH